MNRHLWTFLLALSWCLPLVAAQTDYAKHIAPLIHPAKLVTLGKPSLHLSARPDRDKAAGLLGEFVRQHGIRVLNVAGPRGARNRTSLDSSAPRVFSLMLAAHSASVTP